VRVELTSLRAMLGYYKQRRWPDPKQVVETAFTHAQGKETATYDTVI